MEVAIVKYNAGNICSVINALKRLGIEPILTDEPAVLRRADRVLFPGQGEAGSTMTYLREHHLDRLIKDLKQPVLGICIGQQLMCRHSEESDTDCLGIFDVDVVKFRPHKHEDKVPHMGWNKLSLKNASPLLDEAEGEFVYFVHSFHCEPEDKSLITAVCDYGMEVTASVGKGNVQAFQFHPEKSSRAGLALLKKFVEM